MSNEALLQERKNNWIENNLTHEITFFQYLQKIFPSVTMNDNMLFRAYEHGSFADWKVKDVCKWMDDGLNEIIYIIGDSTREKELKEKMYPDFFMKYCYQY